MNPVMGEPLAAGALNDTTTDPSPRSTCKDVGTPGTPAGVTSFEAFEAAPDPTRLVAVTVKL